MESPELETALRSALERHLAGPSSEGGDAFGTPPNLADAVRYSLLAPGKRIRPRLALACAGMTGLASAAALPAAIAIEMIHCFTLIHDDLPCMDDDDFRRGRPSNHKVHGEAIALLAGDALMTLALESLADAGPHAPPEGFQRALRRFAWATGPRGVMGGQAAEALLGPGSSLADLRRMHAMKTGALFSAALLIPKDLAGIPDRAPAGQPPLGEALERFAAELGLAFQVVDDLEDGLEGTEANRPTSVLYYQSADQASRETLDRLESATRELADAWGTERAGPLASIAHEVLARLRGVGPRKVGS